MKYLLTFLTVCLFSSGVYADSTFVSGTIDGQTWTTAGSPYIMVGDLFIASLVIQPGVMVMADGDYEIEVAGIITAIGTEQDFIVFTTTDSVAGWQGLLFNFTTFASKLQYCNIQRSTNSGIRVINSTPTIENCTLSNNSAAQGGAIYFFNDTEIGSEFTLSDCTFIDNTSLGDGGALYVSLEEGHIILDHSNFIGNFSNPLQALGNFVGGALNLVNGDATILNSLFKNNRTDSRCSSSFGCNVTARGGAIFIGSLGNVTMENSVFLGNQTHAKNNGNCAHGGGSFSYGGAVYVNAGIVNLNNNIFGYNLTTRTNCGPLDGGGGVYVNGGTVTVTNCTIAENSDATGVHCVGGTLDVINSIIYFNNGAGAQVGGSCAITYSSVQDGYDGEGNISNNPVFVDGDSTFHLTSISPCIDAGNPGASFNDICFPPSRGGTINDMGAYGGPGACGWPGAIIPVELVSFTSSLVNGDVKLEWSTSTETNNQMFEIERRLEESQFVTIGFVNGYGTTTETHTYSYLDNTVETGTYYYRLKQIDFDGTVNYSNEVSVDLTAPLDYALEQNYPNPFNPSTNIHYSLPEKGNVELIVYDVLGNQVATLVNEEKSAGRYEVKFSTFGGATQLSSGIYFYKLQANEFTQIKKMILLK